MDIKKIQAIVVNAIKEYLDTQDLHIKINENTTLFGDKSILDSLGLVNLIVSVESTIEDEFDVSIAIADERAISQKHSPFRTVGTLADYIEKLLEEESEEGQ